jgi:hypothetical protein
MTFTEILCEDAEVEHSGNAVTGEETITTTGLRTSYFEATGTIPAGSFDVTEASSGSFASEETVNTITGLYAKTESALVSYHLTQDGDSGTETFALTVSGRYSKRCMP